MKTHLAAVLAPILLLSLLVATEGNNFFPRFKSKRKNGAQISERNSSTNANLPPLLNESIVHEVIDTSNKEEKSLTVVDINGNQPSISFDGLNGGTLTGGLIPPIGLVGDVAGIVAKAGFVSSIVATLLSSLLLPLQITDVILSIIAISMTIAYAMGVTRLTTLRSDTVYSEDNELPEFKGVFFSPDLSPPGFIQISQSDRSAKKKKKSDTSTVWNTVFETRSFSKSPFLQDLSQIVYNALVRYSRY